LTPSFGIGDLSGLAQLVFENHNYAIGQNTLPVISNTSITGPAGAHFLTFTYSDANGDFPLTAQHYLNDPGTAVDFIPSSLDFTQPVTMSAFIGSIEYEFQTMIRVSDNNIDFVTDWLLVSNEDETLPTPSSVMVYPNPFNPSKGVLHFKHTNDAPYPDNRIWIYNPKGQLVKLIDMEANIHWDGRDNVGKPVGDGIYYLRHSDYGDMKGYKVRKIMVIR